MKYFKLLFVVLILCSCTENTDNQVEYFEHGEYELIFQNDSNGINFFFVGSEYIDEQYKKDSGQYRMDGIRIINEIFNTSPFSEYKEYFNAYIVYLNPDPNADPFESSPRVVIQSLQIGFNEQHDVILVSVNDTQAHAIARDGIAFFPYDNNRLLIHEIGHAFAGLSDEYYYDNGDLFCNPDYSHNLDTTNDLNLIKWKHFIGLPGYDEVGAYSGGCGSPNGVWRSNYNSVMRHGINFNAPSRETIVKKIMEVKEIEYNFDDFLLKDINN